jgi:hypothetical protein
MKANEFNLVKIATKAMPIKSRRKALKQMSENRKLHEAHGLYVEPYVHFHKITDIVKDTKAALIGLKKKRYEANSIKDPKRKAVTIGKLDKLITLILSETK